MAICPYCGSQIGDEAEICGFCGGKVTVEGAAEALTREIPEPAEEAVESIAEAAVPVAEAVESVPDDGYEGIPDDILGSVLGTLSSVRTAPLPEEAPPEPVIEEAAVFPEEEIPVFPEAEVPVIPAEEEIPVIPAEEAVYVEPEAPAAEIPVVPVTPAVEPPAPAEPVYAKPVEPAKKNNWLIPAIVVGALALLCILFFALRGCGGAKANDPNVGVYKATLVEMYGIQLDPNEIYENGFVVELKNDGTCEINAGDSRGKGNWSVENGTVTIDDGSNTITGSISDDVIKLENMLDMGLDITLEKQE